VCVSGPSDTHTHTQPPPPPPPVAPREAAAAAVVPAVLWPEAGPPVEAGPPLTGVRAGGGGEEADGTLDMFILWFWSSVASSLRDRGAERREKEAVGPPLSSRTTESRLTRRRRRRRRALFCLRVTVTKILTTHTHLI